MFLSIREACSSVISDYGMARTRHNLPSPNGIGSQRHDDNDPHPFG